jgi:hypothetical protein
MTALIATKRNATGSDQSRDRPISRECYHSEYLVSHYSHSRQKGRSDYSKRAMAAWKPMPSAGDEHFPPGVCLQHHSFSGLRRQRYFSQAYSTWYQLCTQQQHSTYYQVSLFMIHSAATSTNWHLGTLVTISLDETQEAAHFKYGPTT